MEIEVTLQSKGDSYIIGTVKNAYGVKTADAITSDRIDEWIFNALVQELKARGVTVRRIESFPPALDSGVQLLVRRIWVEQDPGFWTVGAITELSILVEIYAKGNLLRKVVIEGKGDSRSMLGLSAQKEESLEKALQAVIKQVVAEVESASD